MRNFLYFFSLLALATFITGVSALFAQPPANDSCGGAFVISGLPYHFEQDTRLATPDSTDPILLCADSGGGNTVWFVYTADSTRFVRFSTASSTPDDYDVALGLFTGSCGSLVEVDCNDDIVPGTIRQAVIATTVDSGVTYYLHVAEWAGGGPSGYVPTGGDLVLDVFESTPDPLYMGPMSGSVTGGDSITLSLFGGKNIPVVIDQVRKVAAENPEETLLPAPSDVRPAKGPRGSNFITDPSISSLPPSMAQPVVLKNFKGNTATGFIPPDPILAVGPDYVMGLVNSAFMVWDKDGTLLSSQQMSSWFSNVVSPVGFSDPQVLYDHFDHRWIMTGGQFSPPYGFLISVSDDDDPFGTWYNWYIPATLGDSVTGNLPDYPQVGYDSLAIYITTNEFNPGLIYSRTRIIEKQQLYNNDAGPVTWTDFWNFKDPDHTTIGVTSLRPSIIYGSPGVHFLVNTSPYNPGTFFTIWTIHDPVGSPTLTAENVSVVEYLSPSNAQQLGGGTAVEAGGGAIRHKAVYRDSSLWMVHSVASGTGDAYSALHYVRINPHTGTNLEDVSMGGDGYWHYYPALMVDGDDNIVITYTRSGLTEYPGAYVAGHKDVDAPGLSPSIPLMEGAAHYEALGDGRNRWGDYNGVALDPADSLAVWVNTEFSVAENTWETRVGMVKMGPLPGAFISSNLTSMTFGTIEVTDTSDSASFAITNNGIDTLEISSIDLPDSNFHITNMPSFPLKLGTFDIDTLWVRFAPEDRGSFADSIMLNSNDTVKPALKISVYGTGFIIDTALSGTTYASSGVTDFGRLRTVDPINASTGAVGPSDYTQLLNIRVRPSSGELWGLATNSTTTAAYYEVVRVNSLLGDAHPVTSIPMNFLKGMTFRDDTMYVGRITGGVYTVDLSTGTPTLVASCGLQLSGIDFNPVSGELWASVKGGAGPVDGIYKIDLNTGTPTLVGSTGFGVPTVDIAFDANGTLFGLIGTGTEENEFVIIDTLTGGGTKVGPMGFSSGQSIAFHPDVANFAFSYHLFQKWNLMSLPVNVPDNSLPAIFPDAMTSSKAYSYDGGFMTSDTLHNRVGYWVKIVSAGAHSIIGVPDSTDTIGVEKRWNLIGPNSFTAPVGSITTDPPAILVTGFYAYDDTGYVLATDLIPGRGYWTKADSAGTIHFNVPSNVPEGTPKLSPRDYLAENSSIVIDDGIGHYQTLYFGPAGGDAPPPEAFEMPPMPPEAGFDARFASGRMVELHDPSPDAELNYPIRIVSWQPSVTVTWNIKGDGSVSYALGSVANDGATGSLHVMENRGSVVLSGKDVTGLGLIVGSRGVPKEFALGQNYPNPFNPSTTVTYELPTAERVSLVVYNTLGERVMTVLDGARDAGYHAVKISANNLASGVYYYRITAGSFTSTRKMILIR